MSTVTVNMPQMAVVGLSENWLLRYCGDRHWMRLCESLGIRSGQLTNAAGERLYASFVAIRERATRPLAHVQENDSLATAIDLKRYGRSIFRSCTTLSGADISLSVEMVTKFVSREEANSNRLRASDLRPDALSTAEELDDPPELTGVYQRVKRGLSEFEIQGIDIPAQTGQPLDARRADVQKSGPYHPNPYVDYNGAGLLYFASYPTIADHLERLLLAGSPLCKGRSDWALRASTLARDTFYFGNLDLGDSVVGALGHAQPVRLPDSGQDGAALHMSLFSERDGKLLAEIFTVKQIAR